MSDAQIINTVHNAVQSVSTTEVQSWVDEKFGYQPVLTHVNATGNHASSKFTVYVPEWRYRVNLAAAAAVDAVDYYVPVDTASGHVVNGLTVTTSDYLLACGSSGWVAKVIAAVTDDAGEDYCHLTVGVTFGKALTTNHHVYIVREENITDVVAGDATVTPTSLPFACGSGVPFGLSATSGDATDTDVAYTVQLIEI